MKCIGIIWTPAYKLKDEITKNISSKCRILTSFSLPLNNVEEFVNNLYKCENMEQWKIDKKLLHMNATNESRVKIFVLDIDTTSVYFHPFKKKNVFYNIESLKEDIRDKYKDRVLDYYFDIIFHLTDSQIEFNKTMTFLKSYIKKNYQGCQDLIDKLESVEKDDFDYEEENE